MDKQPQLGARDRQLDHHVYQTAPIRSTQQPPRLSRVTNGPNQEHAATIQATTRKTDIETHDYERTRQRTKRSKTNKSVRLEGSQTPRLYRPHIGERRASPCHTRTNIVVNTTVHHTPTTTIAAATMTNNLLPICDLYKPFITVQSNTC